MQPLVESIYPELDELGGFRVVKGHLDEGSYNLGGLELTTPAGMDYDLTLTNTGEAVLLQGSVTTQAHTVCARCLAPTAIDIDAEVQGYFLLDPADVDAGYEADEVQTISPEGDMDLSECIQAALCFATPSVILCKEDCLGLCPKCGADLNVEECTCGDEVDPTNPFAALAGLSFSDEDVARGEAAAKEHADDEPLVFEEEPELSPEEQAELTAALDAIFAEDAEGSLDFDDDGNLIFTPAPEDEAEADEEE